MTASSTKSSTQLPDAEALLPADAVISSARAADGHTELTVDRSRLLEVLRTLKERPELDCDLLLDICGVDYPRRDQRFEVVYHIASLARDHRFRVKVPISEDDATVPSAYGIWKAADWFEREAYDLFGITFEGHPNLKRILTHGGFHGHALRKDYDPGQRWLLTEEDSMVPAWATEELTDEDHLESQVLNLGPSHPATHGTLRVVVRLEGETISKAECEIGYLHRCFEKMSETHGWNQVIPYTDRLNYCSSMINGVGYALAVEKMLGVEAPPRAQAVRVILSELSRIMDHAVCLGANLVDLGALTNFWYFFQPREEIYGLLEACAGGRLTVSYARVGGLAHDVPADFEERVRYLLDYIPKFVNDVEKLITTNKIFRDRTEGIGVVSPEDAVAWGWTGPCLRASGVPYDVRKAHPYMGYEQYDFDVPVASTGDTYARYLVRMEEMRQSLRIIRQAIDDLPEGPVITDDHHVALPPKEKVYTEMEALIWHFKLIYEGIHVPKGDAYSFTEGANGELGYYIVSDGSGHPYRLKVRPPCFAIFQAFPHILEGHMVPDAIAILGSLNIIAGELDR
ncbi:MAG: NADH-quinone oxidoreductase subunit D [Acidobacteria bacterium]|jgi:NADH-quinone oxidoreductase subunit C/D|nr:NADH-quinone oxidoreductase subunit D [Acidobacteriota bacterium]